MHSSALRRPQTQRGPENSNQREGRPERLPEAQRGWTAGSLGLLILGQEGPDRGGQTEPGSCPHSAWKHPGLRVRPWPRGVQEWAPTPTDGFPSGAEDLAGSQQGVRMGLGGRGELYPRNGPQQALEAPAPSQVAHTQTPSVQRYRDPVPSRDLHTSEAGSPSRAHLLRARPSEQTPLEPRSSLRPGRLGSTPCPAFLSLPLPSPALIGAGGGV